jgi:hypothetical protein
MKSKQINVKNNSSIKKINTNISGCQHKLVENHGIITCLNCSTKAIRYLLPLNKTLES